MKRWIKYSLVIITVVILISAGYYFIKTSYNGSDRIVLLNSGNVYKSLQEVIQLPEFKNKIVYVDVWGTSCGPCFEELENYTPQLTERYKDAKDITFLYICIDRHPFPELRWKDKIKMFKPNGYHVLVTADEESKLAKDIIGQATDGQFFPYIPFYFIVNKQGQFIGKPSADPSQAELHPSDKNLLYNKLDSLRKL